MPSVVTANLLRTGAVVYLTADGQWVSDLGAAAIATDAAALAPLESLARAAVARQDVTAVYAFDVHVADGHATALSVRETIRAAAARGQ